MAVRASSCNRNSERSPDDKCKQGEEQTHRATVPLVVSSAVAGTPLWRLVDAGAQSHATLVSNR
jgi:hypothetical protein